MYIQQVLPQPSIHLHTTFGKTPPNFLSCFFFFTFHLPSLSHKHKLPKALRLYKSLTYFHNAFLYKQRVLAGTRGLSKHAALVLATALLQVHNHQKPSRKQKGMTISLSLALPSTLLGQ